MVAIDSEARIHPIVLGPAKQRPGIIPLGSFVLAHSIVIKRDAHNGSIFRDDKEPNSPPISYSGSEPYDDHDGANGAERARGQADAINQHLPPADTSNSIFDVLHLNEPDDFHPGDPYVTGPDHLREYHIHGVNDGTHGSPKRPYGIARP